jgi:hypothetical protein
MNKFITYLVLAWLVILTGFTCYIIRAEREFLKFADFVVDDNLKNVIKSGGATFYIVDMEHYANAELLTQVPLWQPVYVKDTDMKNLVDWKRKYTLMVRDFQNIDFQSITIAASADRYIKLQMAGMEDRKLTPEEKSKIVDKAKRRAK